SDPTAGPGAELTVSGPVTADGTGADIALSTTGSGDIALEGTVTADDDAIAVSAAGAIDGPTDPAQALIAQRVELDAGLGIGAVAAVQTRAEALNADAVNGAIDLDNTFADAVTVEQLRSQSGGAIDFDQSGGNVTFNDVRTAGTATLGASANLVVAETGISAGTANLDAGGSITGGVIGAGTANLDAGNLINVTTAAQTLDAESATGGITIANALAADVTVTGLRALGTGGIDFDQAGGGSLEIQAASTADGGIDIANSDPTAGPGAELTVSGPVTADGTGADIALSTTGSGDIALESTVTADDDAIAVSAAGAIDGPTDPAQALIAQRVELDAGLGIGAVAAVQTRAEALNADAVNGAIDLDNTFADAVTVEQLRSQSGGAIDFDQSGGNVTFNDVRTAGTATLGADASIVVGGSGISAGTANVSAGGSLTGGVIAAGLADLDAGGEINVTTAARTMIADSATGGIRIVNTLAEDVTVTALRALGTGGIDFDQAGGGSLEIQAASTADGGIDIANSDPTAGPGAELTVSGPVTADGTGADIALSTTGSGDIALESTVTADDDAIAVSAAGAIDGPTDPAQALIAQRVELDAGLGIGAVAAVQTRAEALNADAVNGAIDLDNTLADAVTVEQLRSRSGDRIDFDQSGGDVTFNDVETAGTATLGADASIVVGGSGISAGTANVSAGGSLTGGVIAAGLADLDAGGEINVTTTAQILDAESATGGITIANALAADVTVTGLRALGTGGIDFDQTGGGSLEIQAASTADGGIDIANANPSAGAGAELTVSGPVTADGADADIALATTGSGDIALEGTVTAEDDEIAVSAAGAIDGPTDPAHALVAQRVELDAGLGIGAATAVRTRAAVLDADAVNGAIDLDNTLADAVTVEQLRSRSGDRIDFDQSGGDVTFNDVETAGTATLGADASIVVGGSGISAGTANVSAGGSLTGGVIAAGLADLDAGGEINVTTAAQTLDAESATGGITIANALAADVTVTGLRALGTGGIDFDQTGGGSLEIQAASTADGGIDIANANPSAGAGAELTVSGPVTADGTGADIALSATGSGDIALEGTVTAEDDEIAVSAAGAIDGPTDPTHALVAQRVELDAGLGIGAATAVRTRAAVLDADAVNGAIDLDNTLADAVTVEQLRSRSGDRIDFDQSGGDVTFNDVQTAGTATLGADASIVVVGSGISAGTANVSAGGSLTGGVIAAGLADLDAGGSIGTASRALDTNVERINARSGTGGIFIAEASDLQLGATAPVTTGAPGAEIRVTNGGALTVAQAVTTTGSGNISLTSIGTQTVNAAVTAGGEARLTSSAGQRIDAAVSAGNNATLSAAGGITHGAAGHVSANGAIVANAGSGALTMDGGTRYTAGGPVQLTAAQNIGVGRVQAGTDLRVQSTGGRILDASPSGDGIGNENFLGRDLILLAATGIGAVGDGDIDTAVERIDAVTGSGDIYIGERDAVTFGFNQGVSTGSGDIEGSSGGTMTIGAPVSAGGSDILLRAGNELLILSDIRTGTGDIELFASSNIRSIGPGVISASVNDRGSLALRAGGAVGESAAPILMDIATVAAQADGGGVFLTQIDGGQGNLIIGRTTGSQPLAGITATNGNVEVRTLGDGSPPDHGRLDVTEDIRIIGTGDILLATEGPNSDIFISALLIADNGTTTLDAGRRVLSTYDLSGVLIQSQMDELATVVDSTLILARYFSGSLAEAYAIPDYGVDDDEDILYLSDGNEALWGPADDGSAGLDDDDDGDGDEYDQEHDHD
ncbi:hypothetical protein, partial [Thiohalocapsa sp. ML1]|uniref:beta strand repeat-containing protein n=1 Tax=Thiohalocapsa sp. ML1 TaxID=1431688 RepID=UPI000AA3C294